TTSPYGFIEVAARAQKWMDQAISRNMYLETRDIDETMNIYMSAWEKGMKTTYYLHMKPRHSAEQSTVAVNKAQKMGRMGFGGLKKTVKADESELLADSAPATMILEPMESPIKEIEMPELVALAKAVIIERPVSAELTAAIEEGPA